MMILTNREEQLLEEIYKWEESLQSVEATEMELLYEEWLEKGLNLIPASVRETYLHKIDEGLFQLTALIQGNGNAKLKRQNELLKPPVYSKRISQISSEMNSFK